MSELEPKQEFEWFATEDDLTWQLFRQPVSDLPMMASQIIKAPKTGTPYAEYWPNAHDTKFIVDALNRAEAEPLTSKDWKHIVDELIRDRDEMVARAKKEGYMQGYKEASEERRDGDYNDPQ